MRERERSRGERTGEERRKMSSASDEWNAGGRRKGGEEKEKKMVKRQESLFAYFDGRGNGTHTIMLEKKREEEEEKAKSVEEKNERHQGDNEVASKRRKLMRFGSDDVGIVIEEEVIDVVERAESIKYVDLVSPNCNTVDDKRRRQSHGVMTVDGILEEKNSCNDLRYQKDAMQMLMSKRKSVAKLSVSAPLIADSAGKGKDNARASDSLGKTGRELNKFHYGSLGPIHIHRSTNFCTKRTITEKWKTCNIGNYEPTLSEMIAEATSSTCKSRSRFLPMCRDTFNQANYCDNKETVPTTKGVQTNAAALASFVNSIFGVMERNSNIVGKDIVAEFIDDGILCPGDISELKVLSGDAIDKLQSWYKERRKLSGDSELWTTTFRAQQTQEVCGNSAGVYVLRNWLREWRENIYQLDNDSDNADQSDRLVHFL